MLIFLITGTKMQKSSLILNAILLLALTSCSSYDFSKRIVQQGNLLSPTTVNRLAIGMSKEDVAILMGTSLLSPRFNNNRWDYAYTRRVGSTSNTVRHASLYFVNNRLSKIDIN